MSTELTTTNKGALVGADNHIAAFDAEMYSSLYRISETMAQSSLIPDSLKGDGGKLYPIEKVTANCFLVAEQAYRWGLSPFAVIQCASVVYGRLMWEGKLVAAVIEAKLGVRLSYEYSGEGSSRRVVVSGTLQGEDEPRTVTGTVGTWKTSHKGSPWADPNDHDRQLAYRGAREWARRHAPGVILGVITEDEAQPMRNVTPASPVRADVIDPFRQPAEQIEDAPPKEAKPAKSRAKKATPAPQQAPEEVSVMEVTSSDGETDGRRWTRYVCVMLRGGKEITARTFSDTVGAAAHALVGSRALAVITDVPNRGLRLDSISPAQADQPHQPQEQGELI